jgi:hypothetical protein
MNFAPAREVAPQREGQLDVCTKLTLGALDRAFDDKAGVPELASRAEKNNSFVEAGFLAKGSADSKGISFDAFKAADASMDSMIAGKGKLMSGIVMESSANNKALG